MGEMLIRTLSGLLYIVLLVGAIFLSELSLFLLFLIFGLICLYELQNLFGFKNLLAYFILGGALVFFTFWGKDFPNVLLILSVATLLVNLLLIYDLLSHRTNPTIEKYKHPLAVFYMIASFVFILLIPFLSGSYTPIALAGIFILIWTNDTFAYLIGKTFGKHKLFERISPNKTIEGFLGGLLFCCLIAYLIFIFTDILTAGKWIGLALITSIFGTLGDLFQSKLKRRAGVKDSGTIMPGHGGLFDRLDSILFASAFIYGFLLIM